MDWNKDSICLYLDNELLNYTLLNQTINAPGVSPQNPFLQKHYFLLNLAIGSNGGDPSQTTFPLKYEVDYIRVYQPIVSTDNVATDLQKFRVFPNPASTNIQVQHSEPIHSIKISDLSGRVLEKIKTAGSFNSEFISLEGITNGVYLMEINAGNSVEVSRLIVRK